MLHNPSSTFQYYKNCRWPTKWNERSRFNMMGGRLTCMPDKTCDNLFYYKVLLHIYVFMNRDMMWDIYLTANPLDWFRVSHKVRGRALLRVNFYQYKYHPVFEILIIYRLVNFRTTVGLLVSVLFCVWEEEDWWCCVFLFWLVWGN